MRSEYLLIFFPPSAEGAVMEIGEHVATFLILIFTSNHLFRQGALDPRLHFLERYTAAE